MVNNTKLDDARAEYDAAWARLDISQNEYENVKTRLVAARAELLAAGLKFADAWATAKTAWLGVSAAWVKLDAVKTHSTHTSIQEDEYPPLGRKAPPIKAQNTVS